MFLGLREIRRAQVRFALLAGAVGLLVFLVLFVQALTGALIRQFIGAIDNQSAAVLVYSDQARRNLEGSIVPESTVGTVAALPGVGAAAPLGEGTFTVTAGEQLRDAVLFGFVPGEPGAPTTVVAGRLPTADFEATASEGDAGDGFGLGDTVRLVRGGREIRIVGIARDTNYSVSPTLFTTFDTFVQARRDANPDAVTISPSAVAVQPAPGTSAETVRDTINANVDGVEALTRAQAVAEAPGVASVSQSIGTVVFLCLFVVVVVAGLFFLILTVQKAQALTLLRAIGVRSGTLVRALLVQVVLVVVAGVAIGSALTALTLSVSGNNLGARLSVTEVVTNGALVLVLSVLASVGATRRVLRIDPVQATIPGAIAT